MMHDILLSFPAGEAPTFADVQDRLRASERFGHLFSEEHSTPEQVILADGDTGVFAILAPGGPPPEESGEEETSPEPAEDVLLFQIPYLRPRFFAEQGATWASALASELGCTIEDPGGADIVASWQAGNHKAVAESAEPPEEGGPAPTPPTVVPAAIPAAAYRHNSMRSELLEKASGAEVPRLVMALMPLRKEPALVGRYTAGEPVWLPDAATHLVLERQKKTWLGTRREELVVDADAVRGVLAPFEKKDGAPAGERFYKPELGPADPAWQALEGTPARGLAVLDWTGVVDD